MSKFSLVCAGTAALGVALTAVGILVKPRRKRRAKPTHKISELGVFAKGSYHQSIESLIARGKLKKGPSMWYDYILSDVRTGFAHAWDFYDYDQTGKLDHYQMKPLLEDMFAAVHLILNLMQEKEQRGEIEEMPTNVELLMQVRKCIKLEVDFHALSRLLVTFLSTEDSKEGDPFGDRNLTVKKEHLIDFFASGKIFSIFKNPEPVTQKIKKKKSSKRKSKGLSEVQSGRKAASYEEFILFQILFNELPNKNPDTSAGAPHMVNSDSLIEQIKTHSVLGRHFSKLNKPIQAINPSSHMVTWDEFKEFLLSRA